MTSNRFFIKENDVISSPVLLRGKEHRHLSKVVRIKPAERIWLFDEKGINYLARVEEIHHDHTRLIILERKSPETPRVLITLGQALLKLKAMEIVLQRAAELGAHIFVPVVSSRSIIRIEEKQQRKIERWNKIVMSAAKQCGRTRVPDILFPQTLEDVLEKRGETGRFYLSEKRGVPIKHIFTADFQKRKAGRSDAEELIVLIGPEGGWTEQEERDILKHDYEPISLGRTTYRAETAAVICLAMMTQHWNE